jgi:hypothetical protein
MDDSEKKPEVRLSRPVSPRSGTPVPVNPNGRPKGSPNKATTAVREAIADFIQTNSAHLDKWAKEIYDKRGAEGAMDTFLALLEYAQPKLARTEMQNLDAQGNPADQGFNITVRHVKAE